ncbi:DUF885 domain-containing protein [Klenkia brasiliensis]|uniref:Uncharacterized conserved protein, DUF885 familyt n=1 Tax=Klenkia brasiliensis TaxID=333142 RepID=A0A1G7UEU1_9ACTN|nr:DUF885 domain-containing protein [Klenkia brasiliensis]SDG46004.1 Uncharacterized conserved protein, DUF885 familyt [Klenkia brasiliensis]
MTTDLEQLADRFVDEYAAAVPTVATYIGVRGHDHRWPDHSPAGHAAVADLLRRTAAAVEAVQPVDHREEVARAAMVERLSAELARYESGWAGSDLNSIECPLQKFRETFDGMAVDTVEDWTTIAARLEALPAAVDAYLTGLDAAADAGKVSAARQVRLAAAVARRWAGTPHVPGFFTTFVAAAPAELADRLRPAADGAHDAFLHFADHVERSLLPRAPEADGVGRDRYALESRFFTGADLDLEETYAWGWAELARVVAEKAAVAETIAPGQGVAGAMAVLDADPARQVRGRDALQRWLQDTADRAVAALDGVHFDIPAPVRRIEGRLTPTSGAGVYYSGPTEDFSRPGRMWWSLPDGVDDMTTWRETTTVFHEGVPGHHLQIGTTVHNAATLNRWQRLLDDCSAHAEGWALYSERLMGELGFLDDAGDRLGMLDAQELRAARVVLDIGVHLDLPIPPGHGVDADRWSYDVALQFLRDHVSMEDRMLVDELHRYLGWPGQAPVYKVGERVFLAGREAARARHGDAFDLKAWHRAVLDLGPLGLGPLAEELDRL